MWRSIGRIERLAKALEFRKINSKQINIYDLERILVRRNITDAKLIDVYNVLLKYLEPNGCQMYHCEHHGVDGFCNCCKNLVPSKCKKHRDFLRRCRARAVKSADWFFEIKKEKGYNDLRIPLGMDSYQFFTALEKVPGFESVGKWVYRLRKDAWKEIKHRVKKEEIPNATQKRK